MATKVKAGLAILTTGRTNLKVLKDFHNDKNNTQFKSIPQFRKFYNQPSNEATEQYLANVYNNDLANRKAQQKQLDKNSKNEQITELKARAVGEKPVYIQEVVIVFLKRDKDTKQPFVRATQSMNVFADTQAGLKQKAEGNFVIRKNSVFEAKGIGYIQHKINKLLADSPTEIKIVGYNYGKIYTNQNQIAINRIRMREETAFLLDDAERPEWDTGNGKCVYDAIIHSFGKSKGLIKKMNEQYLTTTFQKYDEENLDPLTNGVNLEQILGLCSELNISCYAFDIRDNLISKTLFDKSKGSNDKHHAFVFRMYNNHIYPITDDYKRKSLIERQKDDNTHASKIVQQPKTEEAEKKIYEVIKNETEMEGNDYAVDVIMKSGRVPFPFTSHKIKYDNGNIKSFKIGDKLYMTEKTNNIVEDYITSTGAVYQGENEMSLLYEFFKETYGNTVATCDLVSNFAPYVLDALTKENVKYRTHFGNCSNYDSETIQNLIKDNGVVGADITKCYSSILDEPMEDWIVYDVLDCVEECYWCKDEPFKLNYSNMELGLYFVETNDFTLFHGSNWYSSAIINYASGFNINFTITHKILPRHKEHLADNRTYFKKYIDYVIGEIGYDTKQKQKIVKNILNGRTHSTAYDTNITNDINEVWNGLGKKLDRIDSVFINNIDVGDKSLHIWGFKNKTQLLTNSLPIYIQILDQSNIKIHKLACAMGGEIVFRKTDMIVSIGGIVPTAETTRYDWGGYVKESDLLKYDYNYKMFAERGVERPQVLFYRNGDLSKYDENGNLVYYSHGDTLVSSNQYKEILDYAVQRGGMLIEARAGTGKSYMFKKWIEEGLIADDPLTRLAFTNCARKNIDGTTIHTAFGISEDNQKCASVNVASYKNKKIILVDEVGMIGKQLWKFLLLVKQKYDTIFIIAGDYRQLPPIENEDNYDYFRSQLFVYLTEGTKIELMERQRYDKEMWDWLENFYEEGIVGDALKRGEMDYDAKHLCYYNKTRVYINDLMTKYHKTPSALYLPHKPKNEDDRAVSAYIFKGLPVMSVKNNKKYDVINSDVFTVSHYDDDIIYLQDLNDERIIEIAITDFHTIFVVNYASTIHKVQGATILQKINIWNSDKILADKHLGYTAISRGKTMGQITIVN